MLAMKDKQKELMSGLLFTVHQHGGDDVTWKPPIDVQHGTSAWKKKKLCQITFK